MTTVTPTMQKKVYANVHQAKLGYAPSLLTSDIIELTNAMIHANWYVEAIRVIFVTKRVATRNIRMR